MSLLLKVRDRWLEHPAPDLVIGLAGSVAWFAVGQNASAAAQGVGVVAGILLGMTTIALGLYLGGSGPRFAMLRELHGPVLRRNWNWILLVQFLATTLSLIALFVGGNHSPVVRAMAGVAALWVICSGIRLFALLSKLIGISDLNEMDKGGGLTIREDLPNR